MGSLVSAEFHPMPYSKFLLPSFFFPGSCLLPDSTAKEMCEHIPRCVPLLVARWPWASWVASQTLEASGSLQRIPR